MQYARGGVWEIYLHQRELRDGQEYTYEVMRDRVAVRQEWRCHLLRLPSGAREVTVTDRWIDRPADSALWSSAFRNVVLRRDAAGPMAAEGKLVLRTTAAFISHSQKLAIIGSCKALGLWKRALPMNSSRFPWWEICLDVAESFEYKYVIVDAASGKILLWEEGPNRIWANIPLEGVANVAEERPPVFDVSPWRGAGVAVPVFSLRSKESCGVGEFRDIKKLADWAAATSQHFIQLLPVNDTTMTGSWRDSYPYNAVSSFALHPQFIHLPDAGVKQTRAYRELREELNALPQVDYERVNAGKMGLLRAYYNTLGEQLAASDSFKRFVKENAFWLTPYAVFCCLRDDSGTADHRQWKGFARYSKKKVDDYAKARPQEVTFWYWVQYILDAQLKDAVAYAHRKGVAIKGDLPIGVSPSSVDAWTHPELFNLDMQAGAPPDAFSADGQNWGFPTYNWDRMSQDGYAWWRARLKKMSEYFDAYRIDHILGFFRIWEIPAKYRRGLMGHFSPALPYSAEELSAMGFDVSRGRYVTAPAGDLTDVLFVADPRRKGFWHPRINASDTKTYSKLSDTQKERYNALYHDFFYRRHDDFWRESALKKLPVLLRSTAMLACGEDLGMIPACVAPVMEELGILSLEIQRMPKDLWQDFADPARYPYSCVCSTGTHDTSTLRSWWEEDPALTQKYWEQMLQRSGSAPSSCEPPVAEEIIRRHLASPAMLTILPLQDWLAIDGNMRYGGNPDDERINIPARPDHYWRWRMHCTLEDLLADKSLCEKIRNLILDAICSKTC